MALQRSNDAVMTPNGCELLAIAEVTSQDPYTIGTPMVFPLISDSSFEQNVSDETITLEGGDTITRDGTTERKFNVTVIGQDVDSRIYLEKTSKNKTYCVVKQDRNVAIMSKNSWTIFPIAKISQNFTRPSKGFEVERTINIDSNTKAITVDLTAFNTAGAFNPAITEDSFSIGTGEGYGIYAQAVV